MWEIHSVECDAIVAYQKATVKEHGAPPPCPALLFVTGLPATHGVDVKVGLAGVPRAPHLRERLTSYHPLIRVNSNASAQQMPEKHSGVIAMQRDVVSRSIFAVHLRRNHVGQAVSDPQDLAIARRKHVRSIDRIGRKLPGPKSTGTDPKPIQLEDVQRIALCRNRVVMVYCFVRTTVDDVKHTSASDAIRPTLLNLFINFC